MRHAFSFVVLVLLAGCMQAPPHDFGDLPMFTLTSTAFDDQGAVPARFTCDGADTVPPLSFTGLPDNATHVALIMDDPDAPAGTWTHWTFWDLPASSADLPEGAEVASLGAIEGENSWGRTGYGGPCPPNGTHRYVFHAFVTEGPLGLPAGAPVDEVWRDLQEVAVARATLTGTYQRM